MIMPGNITTFLYYDKMNLLSYFFANEIEGAEVRGEAFFSLNLKFNRKNEFQIYPATYLKPCAVAITSCETIFRTLTLPKVSSQELPALVRSALESALAIPIDEYEITWKSSREQGGQQLYCFLTPKVELHRIYESLIVHDVRPTWLFPKALCLAEAFNHITSDKSPVILLDIDEHESTCILLHNDAILDIRAAEGIRECGDEASWKPLREIARILLSWHEKHPQTQSAPLFVVGTLTSDDKQVITNFLKKTAFTPPSSSITNSQYSVLDHLPALGAALLSHNVDALKTQCGHQIERCSEIDTREWIPSISLFMLLIISTALVLYGIGTIYLTNRENELKTHFQKLSSLTFPEMPTGFNQNPETLSEIETGLEKIENELKAKDLYPITADIPQLGQLLVWLSDKANSASLESDAQPIELSLIQYATVKRPDKLRPKDHYQVRVDIEFTSGTASQARKFHEELLAPNAYIDPRQEVKWSLAGGKWRASFFLKDKTLYFP